MPAPAAWAFTSGAGGKLDNLHAAFVQEIFASLVSVTFLGDMVIIARRGYWNLDQCSSSFGLCPEPSADP